MQLCLSDAQWTVHAAGDLSPIPVALRGMMSQPIAATIPGCVHTDLMAAGLLDDPELANHEQLQFWIGWCDWQYTAVFDVDPGMLDQPCVTLACDGLDTLATVYCNGNRVGEAENMHVAWRFDVKDALKAGRNELTIDFASPRRHAVEQERRYPKLPRAGGPCSIDNAHNLMRKMACNMGWDWGPDVTTCGIWKPIRIEGWAHARIEAVRPLVTEASPEKAVIDLHVDLERADDSATTLHATLSDPAGKALCALDLETTTARIEVDTPQLWWPIGRGRQPLYTLDVQLLSSGGATLDRWRRRIGLRTCALDTTPDAEPVGEPVPDDQGQRMTLLVNGKPIYCKGANWIPDDLFPHRITAERYRKTVQQARDANMNMLRVWGGGLFEQDAFYEACDELGVMVWQDFLFACSGYPEADEYAQNVEREVRQNVARLASHPSLVLWNGNNECIMGYYLWGGYWQRLRDDPAIPWGKRYFFDMLPTVLGELDPSRPYWPASPFSGEFERQPNLDAYGNKHIWDVWHGAGQYRNYLGHYPRFASEFGYHAPACFATVARSIPPEYRRWNSGLMKLHNKNGAPGQEQTNTRMADDFDPPIECYDDWHYLAQVMQARALSMGIEWFRALHPWCSGALFWQFNDCWPVSSWSAIDGDGREKPLMHAARHFFAPRLVTIKPAAVVKDINAIDRLCVYLHNDSDEAWEGPCTLTQRSLEGAVLAEVTHEVHVAPRSAERFEVPAAMMADPASVLVADSGEHRGTWWFSPDKTLDYPAAEFDTDLAKTADGYTLTVTAQTLLRDLCVFPDRLDHEATIDRGFVTLLPGESVSFHITTSASMTLEDLTDDKVLRCVNAFGCGVVSEPVA